MSQEDCELDAIYSSKEDVSTTAPSNDAILVNMFSATSKATHENDEWKPVTINSTSSSDANSRKNWKVGERCLAPYAEDGKHYTARILNIFRQDGTCEVEYIGYEDSNAIVEMKLLLSESGVESTGDSKQNSAVGEPMEQADTTTSTTTTAATSSGVDPRDNFPVDSRTVPATPTEPASQSGPGC